MAGRIAAFLYGILAYGIFFVAFLYSIGFVGNIGVPRSIDTGVTAPLLTALLINAGLLMLFAVQHSVMARRGFKAWWTRLVPEPVERSTYVLLSSLLLLLLFWQWRAMTGTVWSIENPTGRLILHAMFWGGWFIVLSSTFLISHFDLFGLKQVTYYLRRKQLEAPQFRDSIFYKFVRNPLMLGFLIAF